MKRISFLYLFLIFCFPVDAQTMLIKSKQVEGLNYSKLQSIPSARLLGRYSSGTGIGQAITIGYGLNLSSSGELSTWSLDLQNVTTLGSTTTNSIDVTGGSGGTWTRISGGNVNIFATTSGSGYVRGLYHYTNDASTMLGGIGFAPNGQIYIGVGASPHSTNRVLGISSSGLYVNPDGDASVTVSATQALDVNGNARIRGLSGTGDRMVITNSSGVLGTAPVPSIPTVNDGVLTMNTSGIATGSQTFTANQLSDATFTVSVPGTNLGSSTAGTNRTITSSTGSSTTISVADNDNSSTNELQSISRTGDVLTLSNGGGSFTDSNHKYIAGSNILITGTYPNYTISSINTVVDTTYLSNRIEARVKYSDTASMLSGYVRSSRTLTINGTTYDLSANRTWTVGDVLTSGSYANPSWITSLAWSKITGAPTIGNGTLTLATGTGLSGSATFTANQTGPSTFTVGLNASLNNLNDVSISSPSTGQLLRYNGSSWTNWTPNFLTSNPSLQTVTTVGNTTTNDIAIIGGSAGRNILLNTSVLQLRSTTAGGYVGGVFTYTNDGSERLGGFGFYNSASSFGYGFLGVGDGNIHTDGSVVKYTSTGVLIRPGGSAAGVLPTEALEVYGNIKSSSLASSGNTLLASDNAGVVYKTSINPSNVLIEEVDPLHLTALDVTGSSTKTITATLADASTVSASFTDANTTYSGSTSIQLTGITFQRAALSGDVSAALNSNTTTISNDAVTNAKMANMAGNTIKGRLSSTGDPQDLTPAQVRGMLEISNGLTDNGYQYGKPADPYKGIETGGGFANNIVRVNSNYTVADTDHTIILYGNSSYTLTLPNPASYTNRRLELSIQFKFNDIAVLVNLPVPIYYYGEDGVTVSSMSTITRDFNYVSSMTIQSDGINWWRIN